MRRALGACALGLVAGLAGCGASAEQVSVSAAASTPVPVDVAAVRAGTLSDAWTLAGDVRALSRATLAPQAAGRVDRVTVREGDRVARGDLILQVDPDLAAADVEAAQAARDEQEAEARLAALDVGRIEGLAAGVVSPAELDAARVRRDGAEARARAADAALARAREVQARHAVRAPFAGVVARRAVDPGDHVTVGQAVIDLVGDEGIEVVVDGPVGLIGTLSAGQAATLRPSDASGEGVDATIAGLVPALDPVARTVRARLVPETSAPWLIAGASVSAHLTFDRSAEDAVVVPRDALIEGGGDPIVVRLTAEDTADRVPVQVRARNGQDALVVGALAVGDRVVTKGNERLQPGQSVQVRAVQEPTP